MKNNDILKRNIDLMNQSINRFLKTKRRGTPLYMSFLVTNRCNLCCKHCFYHYNNYTQSLNDELTIDEYIKISNSMENFIKAIFSGGEPFLREDFHEIIYIFQKNNKVFQCSSSTNGQDTDEIIRQVEKIISRNPYFNFALALSLDGFEEYHDLIRGEGTFKKALNTWNELKSLCSIYQNLEIYICPTLNSINKKIMPDFINWCVKKLTPSYVSMLKIRQDPRDGSYLKNIDIHDYDACRKVIEDHVKSNRMGNINKPQTYVTSSICNYVYETLETNNRTFHCFAGKYGGFVDYDGSVGVCEIMTPLGNLRDWNYDFISLWNNSEAITKRNLVEKNECCSVCTHETEGIIPSILFGENGLKFL